jgi:hypothetical protein
MVINFLIAIFHNMPRPDWKKIAENEKAVFYTNDMCRDFGDGYKIIIGENKQSLKADYLLIKDGEMVYAHGNLEFVLIHRDMLMLAEKKL